ncbi:MAG: RNA-binding protein [Spirochaetales bacterium]|nr:MAG: RNA-binding protein [Spirochaetales bacterium]
MRIYVGNLPYKCSEEEIKNVFAQYGMVNSVKIITDRETGRSKGFAFVEMDNGQEAIDGLNGKDFGGRALKVNEARDTRPGKPDQVSG